jgi:hypothetical protein
MANEKQLPKYRNRFHRVRAAIFEHPGSDTNGNVPWYSYSFTRPVPRGDNQFDYVSFFGEQDIEDMEQAVAWVKQTIKPQSSSDQNKETRLP